MNSHHSDDPTPTTEPHPILARRRAEFTQRQTSITLRIERLRILHERLVTPMLPLQARWFSVWRSIAEHIIEDKPKRIISQFVQATELFQELHRTSLTWLTEIREWLAQAQETAPELESPIGIEGIALFEGRSAPEIEVGKLWIQEREEWWSLVRTLHEHGSLAGLIHTLRSRIFLGYNHTLDRLLDLLQLLVDGCRANEWEEFFAYTSGDNWVAGHTAVLAAIICPPAPGYHFEPEELPQNDDQILVSRLLLNLVPVNPEGAGHLSQFWKAYLHDSLPNTADRTTGDLLPNWISANFRLQQYRLLITLWNQGDVPSETLYDRLEYGDPLTAPDNLRRRVLETNKNLMGKMAHIGESWTIRRRTRDDITYYCLERNQNQNHLTEE